MENYIFGDFNFQRGKVLYKNGKKLDLPPKEIAVLHFLISNAGEIISKEEIIKNVWSNLAVSDESLTRCIYVLRKKLGSSDNCRYIETIYGKGYRFSVQIDDGALMSPENIQPPQLVVALFPFQLSDLSQSHILFDYILGHSTADSPECYRFLPAALTIDTSNLSERFCELKNSGATHFLNGIEFSSGSSKVVRIELTESRNLSVSARGSVVITPDPMLNLINISCQVGALLKDAAKKSGKKLRKDIVTIDNIVFQKQHSFSQAVLMPDLARIREPCGSSAIDEETFRSLAGCYFCLTLLNVVELNTLNHLVAPIVDNVLMQDPTNRFALSFAALLNANAGSEREEDFHLQIILFPLSYEVYYHYACYLMLRKKWDHALSMVTMTLSLNSSFLAAKLLHIAILVLQDNSEIAVKLIESLMGIDARQDIVFDCLSALIASRKKETALANAHLERVVQYRHICTFVDLTLRYIDKEQKNPLAELSALSNIALQPVRNSKAICFPFLSESVS